MLKLPHSGAAKTALWALGAVLAATLLIGAYLAIAGKGPFRRPLVPDETLLQAYRNVVQVHSYAEDVETQAHVANRTLSIQGTYMLDDRNLRYSSVATTTLIDPGSTERPSFTVHNVSIGTEVYSLVSTPDAGLKKTIRADGTWHRYESTAIPEELAGIVVPGPVLDNLRLLSQNGAYLTLIDKQAPDPKTHLARYTFVLSPVPPPQGGTLETLEARIGNGTIAVWIDTQDASVHELAFAGKDYRSTTTVSRLDEDLPIQAPPRAY